MARYGKALVAIIYAGLVVAYTALSGDGAINNDEKVQIAIAIMTAVGVWLIPLAPGHKWAKSAVGAILAVLQLLATLILDGIEPGEWLLLLITFGSALGIYVAPAETVTPGAAPNVAVGTGSDS